MPILAGKIKLRFKPLVVILWLAGFASCQAGVLDSNINKQLQNIDKLTQAADRGDINALYSLGQIYFKGDLVPVDKLRAYQFFFAIVQKNVLAYDGSSEKKIFIDSFNRLGEIYLSGIPEQGLAPDSQQAISMFQMASSLYGDPIAQYNLGRIYKDGVGTPRNTNAAKRWFALSAKHGNLQSLDQLLKLLKEDILHSQYVGWSYFAVKEKNIAERVFSGDSSNTNFRPLFPRSSPATK